MEFNRRIYRLSPRNYSAETIAVTFAKTSRSPEPFDEIAAELNEEKHRIQRKVDRWLWTFQCSGTCRAASCPRECFPPGD